MSMGSLFQDKGRQKLCFQLGKMVVPVVSLLITNSDYHKFKLVYLAYRLLDLLRCLLMLNLVGWLVVHLLWLGGKL